MATIPTLKDNLVIENICPQIEGGRFMLKREPGDTVTLTADIFRHSHEKYDAAIFYRHVSKKKWEKADMAAKRSLLAHEASHKFHSTLDLYYLEDGGPLLPFNRLRDAYSWGLLFDY